MTDHLLYARAVVEGTIVASSSVILQCKRSLEEHAKGEIIQNDYGEINVWVWDKSAVAGKIKFIESCPHTSGKWRTNGETLKLEPWQKFFIGEVYGWVNKEDRSVRRYREAILFVARKNGKTSLCASLGLHEAGFGDHGSEAYIAATKQEQSQILWDIASKMIDLMPKVLSSRYKVTVKEISTERGKLRALANKSKTQDGLNPSLAIVDEAAAITDSNQIHVIESGMGSRDSPLMLFITTAQPMRFTLFRSRYELAKRGLQTGKISKATFALIYELDDEGEVDDPNMWIKANPNLGVSVSRRSLGEALNKSINNPREKGLTLCKHFNIWAQGETAWLPIELWDGCKGDVVREGTATIGLDLAQNRDLAAACIVWDNGGGRYSSEWHFWTPHESLDLYPDDDRSIIVQASNDRILTLLDTKFVDENVIRDWVAEKCEQYDVRQIGTDPYFAKKLTLQLEEKGLPVLNVAQSPAMLSDPIKTLENLVLGGSLIHGGYTLLSWMVMNVVVRTRPGSEGVTLEKPNGEPYRKIDGIDACVTAIACQEHDSGSFVFTDMDLDDAPA